MDWGKSIIAAFILFGVFIGTLVTICAREEINLVTEDYYREEIDYQRQIDRIAHTAMLPQKPKIDVGKNLLKVSYPDFMRVQKGVLQLFRPSDARLDKRFELIRNAEGEQVFPTTGMDKGMYRARLRWTMDGQEFFLEQVIHL